MEDIVDAILEFFKEYDENEKKLGSMNEVRSPLGFTVYLEGFHDEEYPDMTISQS